MFRDSYLRSVAHRSGTACAALLLISFLVHASCIHRGRSLAVFPDTGMEFSIGWGMYGDTLGVVEARAFSDDSVCFEASYYGGRRGYCRSASKPSLQELKALIERALKGIEVGAPFIGEVFFFSRGGSEVAVYVRKADQGLIEDLEKVDSLLEEILGPRFPGILKVSSRSPRSPDREGG